MKIPELLPSLNLRVIDKICAHFCTELETLSPGPFQPTSPRPAGGYRLTIHEDDSKHERLRRLKKACWEELEHDRFTVFRAALALLDEVRNPLEIARRAGLAAHKPSSALHIINRARSIVAAL